MINMESYRVVLVIVGSIGMLAEFIFFAYATYLSHKHLPSVEMTMTGRNIHTINWFFSIHAVILFGSVFTWDWHARRQKDAYDDRDWFEARKNVPSDVRRKFIISYIIFIAGVILMFGPAGILHFLGN